MSKCAATLVLFLLFTGPLAGWPVECGGADDGRSPVLVHDVHELQNLSLDLGGSYELANDIDASETKTWNGGKGFAPVGNSGSPFSGALDGRGFNITGLYIGRYGQGDIGLFGYTTSTATIANLRLLGCDIYGQSSVGGFAGVNAGAVSDCLVNGSVNGSWGFVGGLAGQNDGAFSRCAANASVKGHANSNVGGLAGHNDGMFSDCISSGPVWSASGSSGCVGGVAGDNDGGTISNCAATGPISAQSHASAYVGGIAGRSEGGTVKGSYWDNETTGYTSSAGGTGRNTADMMKRATFSGWDFDNVWAIVEDGSYPFLRNLSDAPPEPPVNHPPVWTTVPADAELTEGDAFLFAANATDLDAGDAVVYGLTSDPACAISVDPSTGEILWPDVVAGNYSMNLTATDGRLRIWHLFNLTVLPRPHAPIWSIVPKDANLTEGDDYGFTVIARDEDPGDNITYGVTAVPACGIAIGAQSGLLRWSNVTAGNYSVNVTATDGRFTICHVFNITVAVLPSPVNRPPAWSGVPADTVLNKRQLFRFTVRATDEDAGDIVRYALTSNPTSPIAIDSATGEILWASQAKGSWAINLSATDGHFSIYHGFNLTVVNRAPVILDVTAPNNTRIRYSETARFSANASDADGESLIYVWMENGTVLSREPAFDRRFPPGAHYVVLSITDADDMATLSFHFTVYKPAAPPPAKGFIPGFGAPAAAAALISYILARRFRCR